MNMSGSRLMVATLSTVLSFGSFAVVEGGVNQRQRNQQKRIRQGVRSGELTRNEVRKLEKQQVWIHRHEVKAKSDGEFTNKERAKIHREQERASLHVYKEKHDNQARN